MGSICPLDFKVCVDDLCLGGGCLRANGAELWERCGQCHEPMDPEEETGLICWDCVEKNETTTLKEDTP